MDGMEYAVVGDCDCEPIIDTIQSLRRLLLINRREIERKILVASAFFLSRSGCMSIVDRTVALIPNLTD